MRSVPLLLSLAAAVVTFVALWIACASEPTGSRIALAILAALGGLIFGALLGVVIVEPEENPA